MSDKRDKFKKTVRFDRYTVSLVEKMADANGLSFSKALRSILVYTSIILKHSDVKPADISFSPSGLSDDDKQLLSKILILYSRSSSNLNQGVKALNELKNFSWLDLSHDELVASLDKVHDDLSKVSQDFNDYQKNLYRLVKAYNQISR